MDMRKAAGLVWVVAFGAACAAAPAPVSVTASVSAPAPEATSAPAPEAPPATAPASAPAPATTSTIRASSSWEADASIPPSERSERAIENRLATVRALFAAQDVAFPPAELYFRAFKRERELEVWASSEAGGRMERVATYRICALSGNLGPKRSEGDGQVPEGFYKIQYAWPNSAFHLEMKIGYPNASDKAISRGDPGGAIMIHGACASIGCLAMTDERVEELWTMAKSTAGGEKAVHVHIFPTRAWDEVLGDAAWAEHRRFWTNLREGFDVFEKTRRLPRISIDWQGRYVVREGEAAAERAARREDGAGSSRRVPLGT